LASLPFPDALVILTERITRVRQSFAVHAIKY
jgi:hypothetical protein